ncbi:MAG: hypothetical protein RMI01_09725 [Thermodesulfovibrio sp.]|nr:hypothetical protein [Thermodesulfovibrio sp.]
MNARIIKTNLLKLPLNVIVSNVGYDTLIYDMKRFNEKLLEEFLTNAKAVLIKVKRGNKLSKIFSIIEKYKLQKEVNVLSYSDKEMIIEILTIQPIINPLDILF